MSAPVTETTTELGLARTATPAVLVGIDWITGLQTARILHRRGVPVIGMAEDPRVFAARSRAYREVHRIDVAGPGWLETLERVALRSGERPVLVPCTDEAVVGLARHRERLDRSYRIVLPRLDVILTLMAKDQFAQHAAAHGLPVPRTHVVTDARTAREATAELPFPWVVKPALKTPSWGAAVGIKVVRVPDASAWGQLLARLPRPHEPLVVQEWIDGGESELYSCNVHVDRAGQVRGVFVARKCRQWPPEQGNSASGVEVRNDEVRDLALALFSSVDYVGLGYLEVKREARTGRHVMIEANVGRPTGRSAIAEAGGVDLVHAMYLDALELPLPPPQEQRYTGVGWTYLRHDAQAAARQWRQGQLTLRDWVASLRGERAFAVWDPHDPLPFAVDLVQALGTSLRSSHAARAK